ncbi:unnamed protein product, partial [Heterosigma akashiwo]
AAGRTPSRRATGRRRRRRWPRRRRGCCGARWPWSPATRSPARRWTTCTPGRIGTEGGRAGGARRSGNAAFGGGDGWWCRSGRHRRGGGCARSPSVSTSPTLFYGLDLFLVATPVGQFCVVLVGEKKMQYSQKTCIFIFHQFFFFPLLCI